MGRSKGVISPWFEEDDRLAQSKFVTNSQDHPFKNSQIVSKILLDEVLHNKSNEKLENLDTSQSNDEGSMAHVLSIESFLDQPIH